MAITSVTARGSAVSNTNDASLSVSPTANLTVGKMVFCCSVSDNEQATDGASSLHTIADSVGNTWFKVGEYTDTDGAADDGVSVSIWGTLVTTQIGTGDSITLTLGANKSDKIITLFECSIAGGKRLALEQLGVGQGAISAAVASMTSREYLLIGCTGSEGEDDAKTPDADYVEQFDLISSTIGAVGINVAIHVQTRVATLTGDTCASSAWTNTNPMALLAAMYEVDPVTVSVGLGEPVLTGFSPTVTATNNITVDAGLGQATLAGFEPTVTATDNVIVSTGLGELTINGLAPTLNLIVSTFLGELALTGLEPEVSATNNQVVSADVGALTLTGFEPTVSLVSGEIEIGTGELTITGFSPVLDLGLNIGFGEIAVNGFEPAISISDHQTVSSGVGSLDLTGFVPSVNVSDNISINTGLGELTATGFAVSINLTINTGLGEAIINGFEPTVNITDNILVQTQSGVLDLNGFSPAIQTPVTVSTDTGVITLNGFSPDVLSGTTVLPNVGQLTITGFSPTISITENIIVETGTGQATLDGYSPSLGLSFITGTGELFLAGFEPSISIGSFNIQVDTLTGLLALAGFSPLVTGDPPKQIIIKRSPITAGFDTVTIITDEVKRTRIITSVTKKSKIGI